MSHEKALSNHFCCFSAIKAQGKNLNQNQMRRKPCKKSHSLASRMARNARCAYKQAKFLKVCQKFWLPRFRQNSVETSGAAEYIMNQTFLRRFAFYYLRNWIPCSEENGEIPPHIMHYWILSNLHDIIVLYIFVQDAFSPFTLWYPICFALMTNSGGSS